MRTAARVQRSNEFDPSVVPPSIGEVAELSEYLVGVHGIELTDRKKRFPAIGYLALERVRAFGESTKATIHPRGFLVASRRRNELVLGPLTVSTTHASWGIGALLVEHATGPCPPDHTVKDPTGLAAQFPAVEAVEGEQAHPEVPEGVEVAQEAEPPALTVGALHKRALQAWPPDTDVRYVLWA